jgi:(2S)-methylsuccinyl-CoA dehydrogenase
MATAYTQLRSAVEEVLPNGDVDAHQVAANELAWALARTEAATATAEWADRAGDSFAHDVAVASVAEATSAIEGRSALEAIEQGPLLERIAANHRPLEDVGASEEQRLLRETFREFARREIRPRAAEIHRQDLDLPEEIIDGLGRLGAFGLSIPETYGGSRGRSDNFESMLIVTEELSRGSLAAGGSLITRPEILVRALLRGGTETQKQHLLPTIASGARLVAVATTEPDHGSDVAGIKCRADRAANGWVVNGSKLWCTFAGRAEILMLLLRTGDGGHRGLSVFVAEKPAFAGRQFTFRQPGGGVLQGRAIPTIGYRGMHSFELFFDNFHLPEDALVGGDEWLNRGFYLQLESFAPGRLQTAGRAVGVMQAALDDALSYASRRTVFGHRIADLGLPRAMLGRMIVQVTSARQLSHRAARLLGEHDGQMPASLAKLYASRTAEYVTRDAMQLHGGIGYSEETDVSRYFQDARVLTIFEGAEEVLALRVIARALLTESAAGR